MRHPTEGVLRRLLDEPAGVPDADRRHVAECPVCLVELAAAREDATSVATALDVERAEHVDVDAAWERLSAGLGRTSAPAAAVTQPAPARARRRGALLRRPAVAALAFATVLTGAGVAAANDWLPIFRTEQVAPVELRTDDVVALPDLNAYGDVEVEQMSEPRQAADAESAAGFTGLPVPEVTSLPVGVTGDPTYQVVGQISAIFTFSAEKAAQATAATGEPLPPMPAGLDGSKVRLAAGPGLAEVWSQPSGIPSLIVGRAVAPTAESSGVSFETMTDYLLSLPGVPDDLALQLRTFAKDGTTLPLPVPADQVESSTADVNGANATVLTARNGAFAGVVWVKDGVLTAVAGSLDTDELLAVARTLR
jgi:hypothetical protein